MDFLSSITDRLPRLHPFVWLLAAIVLAALVAVLAFGVSIGTATSYAFLVLFWGGHLFMHGSHHRHHRAHNSPALTLNENTSPKDPPVGQADHSMGCH